jgi:hypothetical protein
MIIVMSTDDPMLPEEHPQPPRRRGGLATALAVISTLALAGGVALAVMMLPSVIEALVPRDDPRVIGAQTEIIADVLEANAELQTQLSDASTTFQERLTTWQSIESAAASWRGSPESPPAGASNPGGDAMPGDDPTGRALLDSIGATNVSVAFDSSGNNCGYSSVQSDPPYWLAVGGCYNTGYRNTLFMAWDPGTEDSVWPIFVHEAMHWYQYEHHYELSLAITDAGADETAWSNALEVDASCRAVFQIGIPIEQFEDTSSPCTALDWHDAWLRDQAAALGAAVAGPDPETFEVLPVTRP